MVYIFVNIPSLRCFYSHFPEFLLKMSSILLKYVKIVNNSIVDFIVLTVFKKISRVL